LVPSSLVGLALFVVLLAPGLAFVLRRERVVPAQEVSAFRESLRVIFVSVVCMTLTGLLVAGIRTRYPDRTPDVGALIRRPASFARAHYAELTWWALGVIAFATLLGVIAGDPRIARTITRAGKSGFARWLTGSKLASIKPTSAVYALVHMFDHTGTRRGRIHVTATMSDGTMLRGYLHSYDVGTSGEEGDFILSGPTVITSDFKIRDYGYQYAVISARNFTRLDLSHLAPAARVAEPIRPWRGLLEPDPETATPKAAAAAAANAS
jgi:Family of unknown function (DUF6338)